MKRVFFLGAGFSAPFGHPVMNDFLGFADGSVRIGDADRAFLGKLVLEARRANSFLESSATNLEDILSFAEMGERLQLTEDAPARHKQLRLIIQRIYTTAAAPSQFYWDMYSGFERLTGPRLKDVSKKIAFITTNYDLNAESLCFHSDVKLDVGFDVERPNAKDVVLAGHFYDRTGIPLHKLHGSVNWYPSDSQSGEKLIVEDRVVRVGRLGQLDGMLPYPCVGKYTAPCAPVVVPPSFLKPDLAGALKTIWANAARELSTTNEVVFIGYSFPPSDTEMMYFLARALAENPSLRHIYVIDRVAHALVARLRLPGSKAGSHFRDLLRPIEGDWTKASLPPIA